MPCGSPRRATAARSFGAAKRPKQRTLFINVRDFDGMNGKRIDSASVLVGGNPIEQVSRTPVEAAGATVSACADANGHGTANGGSGTRSA